MLRYLLLALLRREARHGYELKAAFETLLGGTWRLNIGQIYRELGRLEADGLIQARVVAQQLLPDRKVYRLTASGRKELDAWVGRPSDSLVRLRDDVFVKVLLQLESPPAALDTIWRQRESHLEAMADLQRVRADPDTDRETRLLLDGILFRLEADLRWLDHCEHQLGQDG
jgi:DNA-binding PadR family transcriptional regulator